MAKATMGYRGNLCQVYIKNSAVLAIEFTVQVDAVLYVRILAALQNRAVFICLICQHIAGCNKDG